MSFAYFISNPMKTKTLSLIFLMLLIIFVVSYHTINKSTSPSIRAEQRWVSLIDKDWDKAYSYETPGYKGTYSINNYKDSFGGATIWKNVDIKSTQYISDKNAIVTVKLFYTISGFGSGVSSSTFKEKWLKKNDTWYHVKNK